MALTWHLSGRRASPFPKISATLRVIITCVELKKDSKKRCSGCVLHAKLHAAAEARVCGWTFLFWCEEGVDASQTRKEPVYTPWSIFSLTYSPLPSYKSPIYTQLDALALLNSLHLTLRPLSPARP